MMERRACGKRRPSDRSRTQQEGSGQRHAALLPIKMGKRTPFAKAVVCDLRLCHSYYRQRPFASPSCICILKWKYIHMNFKSAGMGLSMDFGKFVPIFYLFQMC
jgi:hypothetical protein